MTKNDYSPDNKNVQQIILRLDKLLEQNQWDKKHKKIISFHARMVRLKDYVFPFLFFPEIPPDNNASERAIRNIKVKHKISGQFKTILAVQNFATIWNSEDVRILKGVVSKYHAHRHIEYPTKLSVSDIVKRMKDGSSRILQMEFPQLKKRYRAIEYGAWSIGVITDEIVQEYLEHHREDSDKNYGNMILE